MGDPLAWLDEESADWRRRGLGRSLIPHGPVRPGGFERDGRSLVNFGTNDYLGLAADPRLIAAAGRAAESFGWGSGASPLVTGWSEAHQKLAEGLGRFECAEAVALYASGFSANLGALTALVGRGDAVYLDRLDHACLVDGARLSGASLRVFPHNDAERLTSILERDRGRFRRTLIATEGVFSMDGDLAPLDALADLAERFDAMLLVDEAHGTGVFGTDGRGAASECGVADRVAIRVGTLSKALGSVGGFVAGSKRLVDWLINHSRSLVYSTALPPAAAAAALEALAIVEAEPWRRTRVRALGDTLRQALRDSQRVVGPSAGPIVPVLVGDPTEALGLAARLLDRGFVCPAIRPPTVPEGTARLRLSLSAAHTDAELEGLIRALLGS